MVTASTRNHCLNAVQTLRPKDTMLSIVRSRPIENITECGTAQVGERRTRTSIRQLPIGPSLQVELVVIVEVPGELRRTCLCWRAKITRRTRFVALNRTLAAKRDDETNPTASMPLGNAGTTLDISQHDRRVFRYVLARGSKTWGHLLDGKGKRRWASRVADNWWSNPHPHKVALTTDLRAWHTTRRDDSKIKC
jgi:hypothetical protein